MTKDKDPENFDIDPDEQAALRAFEEADRSFILDRLLLNENRIPLPLHHNILIVLALDPKLAGLVQLNEFSGKTMIMRPPPLSIARVMGPLETDMVAALSPAEREAREREAAERARDGYPRGLTEADREIIFTYLQKDWFRSLRMSDFNSCLNAIAHDNKFHPVLNYLESLTWDRKPRIRRWLIETFGCEDNPYVQEVGAVTLLAAVRRVLLPACQYDQVLIIEGEEGIAKSTALQILASPEWFSDRISDFSSKDSIMDLAGVWIMELSEIESIINSRDETAKAFISRKTDNYRKPYGRETERVDREGIMIGTTNETEYLPGVTGNRRYWPVRAYNKDDRGLQWLIQNRDQLWAEAMFLEWDAHKQGLENQLYFEKGSELARMAEEEQRKRQSHDAWDDAVMAYAEAHPANLQTVKILQHAIFLDLKDCNDRNQKKVAKILLKHGWRAGRQRDPSGRQIRVWLKG